MGSHSNYLLAPLVLWCPFLLRKGVVFLTEPPEVCGEKYQSSRQFAGPQSSHLWEALVEPKCFTTFLCFKCLNQLILKMLHSDLIIYMYPENYLPQACDRYRGDKEKIMILKEVKEYIIQNRKKLGAKIRGRSPGKSLPPTTCRPLHFEQGSFTVFSHYDLRTCLLFT